MPGSCQQAAKTESLTGPSRRWLLVSAGALGISCVATQLTLMREMLGVFAGNEMVLGILLGNWLFIMGLGAWAGRWMARRFRPIALYLGCQLVLGPLPWGLVLLARTLHNTVFLRGSAIGATETALASAALLAPYCLLAGGALAVGSQLAGASRVYIADTLGSIVGGMLFSLLWVRWLDHLSLLGTTGFLLLLAAGGLAWALRQSLALGASMVMAIFSLVLPMGAQLDALSTSWQYPGQKVQFRGHSPYGRLVITEAGGQYVFWENGLVLASSHDVAHAEEAAHLPLLQRPQAQRVLLISGGLAGVAREILKHPVAEVVYVELDPLWMEAGRKFLPDRMSDARLRTISADGRQYLKQTREKFDVIIMDLPDPVTAQLNRFFTAEFFSEVKRRLKPGGLVAFGAGRYENYVSPNLAQSLSTTFRTAQTAFQHLLVLPAGRIFFLASDSPLETDMAALWAAHPVPGHYVTPPFLRVMFSRDRLADMERACQQPAPINRDMHPALYYRHVQHWLSQFESPHLFWLSILGAGFLFYIIRLKRAPLAVFVGGFTAASLELLLLLAFQCFCGSLYQQLGLLVAVFMAGLAAGAWVAAFWGNKPGRPPTRRLAVWAVCLGTAALLLPAGLSGLGRWSASEVSPWWIQMGLLAMTFAAAVLVGAEFPVAVEAEGGDAAAAARIYSADFLGASLGGWLAATVLVPKLGMAGVSLLTGGLNLACGLLLWGACLARKA